MEKIKRVFIQLGWFIDALVGVAEQLVIDSLQTFVDILKMVFFVVVCLPLMMLYRWITRKEYEQ